MIFLSFDTEEFDLPCEKGVEYNTLKDGMNVSKFGTERILEILSEKSVKATFFCTSNFVSSAPEIVRRVMKEGHEIASHGCNHWKPQIGDATRSKKIIEDILGVELYGYRQPRMLSVDNNELAACGYRYNASLNPTFIPGRYSHYFSSRTPWVEDSIVQIPASVSPCFRIPMFWLGLHHYPFKIYLWLMNKTIKHDNHFNTYFHPWEFYPLNNHQELKISSFVRRRSGEEMCQRLKMIISHLKEKGESFGTYNEYANIIYK